MKVLKAITNFLLGILTYLIVVFDRLITAPFIGIDSPDIKRIKNPKDRSFMIQYFGKVIKRLAVCIVLYGLYLLYHLIF